VANVKTAILQHALSIALVGIHALGGVSGLPVATTPAGEPSTRSVQYCVPQDDDPNFYRVCCRRDAAKPYRSEAEEHAKNSNCSSVRVHYVKTESRPRWDSNKQTGIRQHDPRDQRRRAGKQQNIVQDSGHRSPLRTRHIASLDGGCREPAGNGSRWKYLQPTANA
jgi:hypothetical protein